MPHPHLKTMARAIRKANRCTTRVALQMAQGWAQGFTYAVEASFADWDGKIARREVFLGNSYEEASAARQVAQRKLRAEGLRFAGGHGVNLKTIAAALAVEAVQTRAVKRAA